MTVLKAESSCHLEYCAGGGQVYGVKLVVSQPALSAEQLARVLQCHEARAFLAGPRLAHADSDPFWLPDSWVDIVVKPDGGQFVVSLVGQSVADNLRILHRATAFAAASGFAANRLNGY